MQSGATFDRSGKYRYALWRLWHPELPRVAFLMLNPATADATVNDPTIKSCISIATKLGFGSMEVVNLFAYRTADPLRLRKVRDPVGKGNDAHIIRACEQAHTVIAAWGNHGAHAQRADRVMTLLEEHCSDKLWCFGITKRGQPRHPLYLKHSADIIPFNSPWPRSETD